MVGELQKLSTKREGYREGSDDKTVPCFSLTLCLASEDKTDRETDRQTDRQTDRRTDRQTDRQTGAEKDK